MMTQTIQTWAAQSQLMVVDVLAQQPNDGPLGPEFGKASPIGFLILVGLAVIILTVGWFFHRRYSRFNRRRMFAEAHGLDVFDQEAVDKAMADAGVLDLREDSKF
ncbi:hypothetical protein QP027_03635 [Corynebacterium breve]|uniref:DUF4381 domain-containing protein n=1 Tax=Corynebacterium breve TaxID=3049799 RepID=A0ABY8VIQ3_9CORY|nr:hypothetical protein [Corynebacterium breve]WIM68498.1 hypothetical protein QP027_03635 [Corynebacterium breve]